MSSAAYWTHDEPSEPVALTVWMEFCEREGGVHRPEVVGGKCFQFGSGVQAFFGTGPEGLPITATDATFTTTWMGAACPEVARLALAWWLKVGGSLSADPEIRALIARGVGVMGDPCRCSRYCGDDGDIDGPGVCKRLPRVPEPPLLEVLAVHRDDLAAKRGKT